MPVWDLLDEGEGHGAPGGFQGGLELIQVDPEVVGVEEPVRVRERGG